jgi:ligand-binding sensor domain-containing protein/signal transduction histidine kinase
MPSGSGSHAEALRQCFLLAKTKPVTCRSSLFANRHAFLLTNWREAAAWFGGALGGLLCWMTVAGPWIFSTLKAAELSPPSPATYATYTYDINAGLPHNSPTPIVQTRDGYLWIGTTAGLARFDGVRFVTYRAADTPGLPDNLIRCLYEDGTGALWVGTQRGLSRYWQGKFELIGLLDTATVSVLEDRTGRLWVGTFARGLWEYQGGQLSEHKDPLLSEGAVPRDVRSLFEDSTGRVWMWIRGKGMAYLEANSLRLFDGFGATSDQGVPMAETPSGTLWFGTEQGVFRLRDGQLRKYGKEQGLGKAAVRHLYVDRKGQLWVSANKLYLLERAEAESFTTVPIPVEYARWVMQDREGSYWVGTANEGLWQVRSSAFRMILPQDARLDGNVRAVAIDRAGTTWASLPNGGVARISADGKLTVVETDGVVSSLCPAADGSVWIGTTASLSVWREGHQQVYPEFKRVHALFQDRAGAIWIGAEEGGGVVRYQNGEFDSSYPALIGGSSPTSFTGAVAQTFAEDAEGTLYMGLVFRNTGVVKLKDGVVTIAGVGTTFRASEIFAIYPDREGNLWVGTRGRGLVVFSQGHWFNPDSLSAPFNDHVVTITEDGSGRLWIGTLKGIVWAPKAELLAVARGEQPSVTLRRATAGDGIRPATVGSGIYGAFPAAWKAADGTILFATQRGVVAVDTKNVSANGVAPLVQIEQVLRNGQTVGIGDEIQLRAGTRALTIDYTALSFVRPEQVFFRYRLEGYETGWAEAGARRTAFYSNLVPGSYTFQIIACNSDGVWNKAGASLAIVQRPFFYQTSWFWGVVAISLGLGVLGVYRVRTAGLRRRNEQLERRIAERTAALAERSTQLAKSYEELKQTQQELLETSRLAGMAEVATGVLHNIGNALNSVNTSANLAGERVRKMKLPGVSKVAQLLIDQGDCLGEFFATDPRGKQLPGYLARLAEHLQTEQGELSGELDSLQTGVDQIKQFVAAQQSYAHVTGVSELVPPSELLEHALRISEASLSRLGVTVTREFMPVPPVKVERQKVLQILVNVIRNAEEAINEGGRSDKHLALGVRAAAAGRVQITVTDNGVGIAAENLTRIFAFGFTTQKAGHGFGLHSGALAAKELGGSLVAQSDGPGKGATFVLELPSAD